VTFNYIFVKYLASQMFYVFSFHFGCYILLHKDKVLHTVIHEATSHQQHLRNMYV